MKTILTIEQANNEIEIYYHRMLGCTSSMGKRSNYYKIVDIIREIPEMEKYWGLAPQQLRYKDKVFKRIENAQELAIEYTTFTDLACAYIVYLEDIKMLKVGKANNFEKRLYQLNNQYGKVTPIFVFNFEDEDNAYLMEVLLHKYFKRKYPYNFIPQDRFVNAICSIKDINILKGIAEEIKNKKWF